jgi:hypothetical protein
MNKNNNALRPSRRSTFTVIMLAASAALAACSSFGPERLAEPAAAPPAVVAPPPPALEPIVLPTVGYLAPVVEPDLLVRLRSGFALPTTADPVVQRERDWYARNQAYLDRVFQRADLYLFHIVAALEERGMRPSSRCCRSSKARSTPSPTRTAARPASGSSSPARASASA